MEARLKSAKRRAVALIHWSAHRCDAKAAPSFLLKILIFNELLWFLRPHTYKKVVERSYKEKPSVCQRRIYDALPPVSPPRRKSALFDRRPAFLAAALARATL